MKEITVYECHDGTRFDSKLDALRYDILLSKCANIDKIIGKKVELEYDQYVQRNVETVKKQWKVFCNIVDEIIPGFAEMAKEYDNRTRHRSHLEMALDGCGMNCLTNLYYRFKCIDEQGREYLQPYFANGRQNDATREVIL